MSQAQAVYIERTITMDGVMTDWYDTDGNTYVPPGDIPGIPTGPGAPNNGNPGQYSTDLESGTGDLDEPLTSTGRDLKKFSFTWDATYLYFYVERYASTSNITDWWFYIDSSTAGVAGTDPDGLMQSGEKLLRVSWQGNTGSTVATLYDYVEVASGGDPLTNAGVGDGYTMPGDKANGVALYNTSWGSGAGLEMETRMAWSSIPGLTGPANIGFHISSSNGQNIPGNIIDNMDGPAGGQLFPLDLQITKTASVTSIRGLQSFDYVISVYNAAIVDFTNVNIVDNLPSQVTFDGTSYTATAGTYSGGVWSIPTVETNTTDTLTITVTANVLPVSMNVNNTATLNTTTDPPVPADEVSSNDSSTVGVTILPIPQLTIVKNTGGVSNAAPGTVLTYTLTVTNTGGEDGELVEITDQISPYERLKIDFGSGHPFNFNAGTSGLTLGTRTYSADYGVDLYAHPLATDPPNTYDDQVTNFKIQFNGSMVNTGGSFTIQYQTQIR